MHVDGDLYNMLASENVNDYDLNSFKRSIPVTESMAEEFDFEEQ